MSFDKEQLNRQYALSDMTSFWERCSFENTAFGQRVFERLSECLPYPIKTGELFLSSDYLSVNLLAETDTLRIRQYLFCVDRDRLFDPEEPFVQDLIGILIDCAKEHGLPSLEDFFCSDAKVTLRISDFRSNIICSDFGSRRAEISREVWIKCNVRVCGGECSDKLFMLLYDTEWQRRLAQWTGNTKRAAEMVLALCRENDPMGVYADDDLANRFTTASKQQLIRDGHWMGVMRENDYLHLH